VPDLLLYVDDHLPDTGLVPAAIELLGRDPELDYEIAGQVFPFYLTADLPPLPEESLFILAHDDPGIGSADETATVFRLLRGHRTCPI